ncbi:NapC/NirT family cytochrome c [Azospirillum sp.]|uniref:NapC/NirT family cytochrome c n=1 Tax=Azospirillum sp. TaxID=34012 RepID=UPI002D4ED403|nr:NapC/NirT family cytochrome c [Azospirillum sp.]HYD68102.1 NapC/NirT family cytochrome c [Azospirillum sp.]
MTANTLDRAGARRPGLIARLWRTLTRPTVHFSLGFLLLAGAVGGVLFWGGFNWAMEATNNEQFCVSCHEMRENVYAEYRGTVHDSNPSGVRATCPDCHVPKDWTHKVIRKIEASKELYHHIIGSMPTKEAFEEQRIRLAGNVWRAMKATDSRECRNCHNFAGMDIAQQGPRARPLHLQAQEQGQTCIDCHKGIAHNLPAGAAELERKVTEEFAKK